MLPKHSFPINNPFVVTPELVPLSFIPVVYHFAVGIEEWWQSTGKEIVVGLENFVLGAVKICNDIVNFLKGV